MESGQVTFIDLVSKPYQANTFDNLPPSQAVPNTYMMKLPRKHLYHSFDVSLDGFRSLFTKVQKALRTHGSGAMFVIDNLNILVNSCERKDSPLEFIEVLNDMMSMEAIAAIGVNRDLLLTEEDVYREAKNSVFDVVIEVNRNLSGYTKDVHGQLNIIAHKGDLMMSEPSVKNLKFRLTENKVEVFDHFVI